MQWSSFKALSEEENELDIGPLATPGAGQPGDGVYAYWPNGFWHMLADSVILSPRDFQLLEGAYRCQCLHFILLPTHPDVGPSNPNTALRKARKLEWHPEYCPVPETQAVRPPVNITLKNGLVSCAQS